MVDGLISFFLVVGGGFALVGSIGLARLPDLFMRLHGPTKATTLGVGGILIASTLHFSSSGAGLSLHELLVAGFLLLTAPVSAHLIARTMLHLQGGAGDGPSPCRRQGDEPGAAPPADPAGRDDR